LTLESFLTALQDGDLLPLKAVIADEVAKLKAAGCRGVRGGKAAF
jgi:hypothetical protein